MKKAYMFMADGFEESECIITVDLLRRGGIDVTTVSISGKTEVTGRSRITACADRLFEDCSFDDADAFLLPGGMPGTKYLKEHQGLSALLKHADQQGKLLCAVCAAPTVLGNLGLLKGHRATCYPGCESGLTGADLSADEVVRDGHFITSRGAGTTIPFALAIIEALTDRENADKVAEGIVYRR